VTTPSAERKYRSKLRRWQRDPWSFLWQQKRENAAKRKQLFTLTPEWVAQVGAEGCPYLHLPFILQPPQPPGSPKGFTAIAPMTPTFDQIEAGEGYTEDNTRIISWWANRAKGDDSTEDFINYCRMVAEKHGGQW
jgi:hypothetical protein